MFPACLPAGIDISQQNNPSQSFKPGLHSRRESGVVFWKVLAFGLKML